MGRKDTAESESRKVAIDVLQAANYIHRCDYDRALQNISHAANGLKALTKIIKKGRE